VAAGTLLVTIGAAGAGIFYQTAQVAPLNEATVTSNGDGTVSITFNWHIGGVYAVTPGGAQKKLVLFSHQQPYSRLDSQGPKLQAALKHLLDTRAITAWYWGHEHQCVIYDPHPTFGMIGRCLGNGGIPEPRLHFLEGAVESALVQTYGPARWPGLPGSSGFGN
jgi:hypothetical protein